MRDDSDSRKLTRNLVLEYVERTAIQKQKFQYRVTTCIGRSRFIWSKTFSLAVLSTKCFKGISKSLVACE